MKTASVMQISTIVNVWLFVVSSAIAQETLLSQQPLSASVISLTGLQAEESDLLFQGEFQTCNGDPSCYQPFGLQVYAVGDGRFQAQLMAGGLPGCGWNGVGRTRLEGKREGDVLELTGGPYKLDLQQSGKMAIVRFRTDGLTLSTLTRVERSSPTMGAMAPHGAIQLFPAIEMSPSQVSPYWKKGRISADGFLLSGTESIEKYQDFQLHLEFRVPFMPKASGQSRGNSGVYISSRYEVQILDSFGLSGSADECGALYKFKRPDVNMAFPPLTWQTYDIWFRAARFNDRGEKITNAAITVQHNGITVHNQVTLEGPTGAGAAESPTLLPLKLQDHGAPVAFRNVWLVNLGSSSTQSVASSCCVPRKKRSR